MSNSAQKAQFFKCSWNRQCRDWHKEDDLADFGSIIIKFWFIMATSRCDCAIANQNFVGIRANSATSVRLRPLCHGGSSECMLKWANGDELETANLKKMYNVYDHCAGMAARKHLIFNIPTDKYTGLNTDEKNCWNFIFSPLSASGFRSTLGIWKVTKEFGYWAVAAGHKYVTFYMFKEK